MNTKYLKKSIVINEACGWVPLGVYGHSGGESVWRSPKSFGCDVTYAAENLPDVFGDLNAVHAAETALIKPINRSTWLAVLAYVLGWGTVSPLSNEYDDMVAACVHAKAEKRAEALYRIIKEERAL